ncbi:MAG: hypothetical protein WD749_04745 [Phycisphaerales bacterium]
MPIHPHAHRSRTAVGRIAEAAAYGAIRAGVGILGMCPPAPILRMAASAGRVYARFDKRHMRRAMSNLAVAFPDWPQERLYAVGAESHAHIFRLGVELARSPRILNDDGWPDHLELGDLEKGLRALISARPCILITGHCGNWELLGYTLALLGFPMHALYRPLDLHPLDRYVHQTRQRRGLTLIDKFGALKQLPDFVRSGAPVGFVADQNAGDRALFVPFFNRLAATYKSIGLLALQFGATIICGCARRMSDVGCRMSDGESADLRGVRGTEPIRHPTSHIRHALQYRIEIADVFGPGDWSQHPDPLFYLTARYRRAIESMIRAAPEQYLWMHRIWRSRPRHERSRRPFPPLLLAKLRALPWMTEADLAQIQHHSARDARTLEETGQDKLSEF